MEHRKECDASELKHHDASRDQDEDRDWVSTP
jgi:hypothetical protein